MTSLIKFALKYPVTIFMMVLAVLLLGYISFTRLGIDLFPDLNNPRLFVELKSGERSPEEIEKQFVESIEAQSIRQRGALEVSSISRVGSAQIRIEYSWDRDMDEAFLDLQKALTAFGQHEDIDEFNITQHNPNAAPVLLLALSHEEIDDMAQLRTVAEDYIRNELIRLEGIADVEVSGSEESEVVIETEQALLTAYQLTPDIIVQKIQSFNRTVSGGTIEDLGRQYVIKGVSVFQSLDDIANIIVAWKQSTDSGADSGDRIPVLLKDVAKVRFFNKEPVNIVRLNGKRCLGLSIYKETKFNTVNAVETLTEALEEMRKALPGYTFSIIQDQGSFISQAINEVEETALFGMLLAVIVLFIFLRRFGTTLIISIAIPISIIATFNLMYFNGLTLNIMTLGGLALGAGMLVDNAIVVMENISRNLEKGLPVKEAALQGTAEVAGAIAASTVTTVVVFLPIVYMHGASGELFKDQAWTVAFSLFSSLFVATLLIPVLSIRFLKGRTTTAPQRGSVPIQFGWYPALLARILNRTPAVIGLSIVLVVATFFSIPFIGSEFLPKTESDQFSIGLTLEDGTDLQRTAATVLSIESMIKTLAGDEIETIYSQIGPSTSTSTSDETIFEGENTASIQITLKEERQISTASLIAALDKMLAPIPALEVQFARDETALQGILGTSEAPIVIEVKGKELGQIELLVHQIKQKISTSESLFNIDTSIDEGAPEIDVQIDPMRASMHNLSASAIGNQLRDQLQGKDAGQWENRGTMQDITVKLPKVARRDFEDIVILSGQNQVRLQEIATLRDGHAPGQIYRRNQTRIGKVTAEFKDNKPLNQVVAEIKTAMKDIPLPPEYQTQVVGEELKREESMANLTFAMLLSIVLVYMVLASQFESLIHPFTILLTIPLAGVGALLIFLVLGLPLNIMAFIGIIMLVGIAVNDSIVLVDAINQFKNAGMARHEAIIQAGSNRIRPIIMTSLTTILALLPLTLGIGESAALRAPMALAVIGGLVTSTLLTLVVIPCVYTVLDHVRDYFRPAAAVANGTLVVADAGHRRDQEL